MTVVLLSIVVEICLPSEMKQKICGQGTTINVDTIQKQDRASREKKQISVS